MAKSFDITKRSDMQKLTQNLENEIFDIAKQKLSNQNFDVNCPHCNSQISVPSGLSLCPICGKEVNLTLDFSF